MMLSNAIAKRTSTGAACALLLMWAGASLAAEPQGVQYKPNEFLGLDLSAAVLSPKPLGPPAQFAPVRIEAASAAGDPGEPTRPEPAAVPGKVNVAKADADNPDAEAYARNAREMAKVETRKPRGTPRVKLARHHGNPLDAQASDTRVQVWPCKSGGICNWQRQ